ncbi:MAG: SDR family NAD(P)-dependent oxidoreductase [Planctomycetota bacterium]
MKSGGFWRDKHVIVTGASSGLGAALGTLAAQCGARVSLLARRAECLAEVADQIRQSGGQVTWQSVDVSQREALRTAVTQCEESLGPCQVAIANAGVYRITDGADYDGERAEQVLQINLLGVSHLLSAVLPGMVARRSGNFCGISSLGGLLSLPGGGAYCASKAALAVLLKSVRLDVDPHGVSITTVFPGFIDTPMITPAERRTVPGLMSADEVAERTLRAIAQGRRECYFPWRLWCECRLGGLLPWPIYRRVMSWVKPLEET